MRGELGALLAQSLEMLEHLTPDLPALMGRDVDQSALQSVIDRGLDVVKQTRQSAQTLELSRGSVEHLGTSHDRLAGEQPVDGPPDGTGAGTGG